MFEKTIRMIQTVRNIVNDYRECFDAIIDWYKDAKLTVKVARVLMHGDNGWPEMLTTVNGFEVERVRDDQNWKHIASWQLPKGVLKQGENEIVVRNADHSSRRARLVEAGVFQENGLGRRTIEFVGKEATFASPFELSYSRGAKRGKHCWTVAKDGMLAFEFDLKSTMPVIFSLEMPSDEAWEKQVREVLNDVFDQVKEKRRELKNEGHGQEIDEMLRSLNAYIELHTRQIERAFGANDATSLMDVIERTGNPDEIVCKVLRKVTDPSRNPPPVRESSPAPARSASHSGSAATAVAKGSGFKFLLTMALFATPVVFLAASDNNIAKDFRRWFATVRQEIFADKKKPTNVLEALRQSGSELGWKCDDEATIDRAQLGELAQMFGAEVNMATVTWYSVGERIAGYPAGKVDEVLKAAYWKRTLSAIDYGSDATAETVFNNIRDNWQQQSKQFGDIIQIVPVEARGTQGAFAARTLLGDGKVSTQSFARAGRFLLYTLDREPVARGEDAREAKQRFEVLAKKLDGLQSSAVPQKAKSEEPKQQDKK